jgi:hypothetical protein
MKLNRNPGYLKPAILQLAALLFLVEPVSSTNSDSLQIRLYHGLDEIGTGLNYNLRVESGSVWTVWRGGINSLFRRPSGSFGELKSDGDFESTFGKQLRPNLDLNAVFKGDFYNLERFEGPSPFSQPKPGPPTSWLLNEPVASWSVPGQKINRVFVGLGGTFRPDTLLKLTTIIGNQYEHRAGFDDSGISASLDGELKGFDYKGYHNNLGVYLEQEELGERLDREIRFNYGLDKSFSQSSSNRLEIYYRQKRHDYHAWGTNTIGTRMDTDQSIRNQLRYDFAPSVGFILDTQLIGSTHEDWTASTNTVRDEVNTANSITIRRTANRLSSWTRMQLDWGAQEDHTGLKRERGTSLEGGMSWYPSTVDSTSFVAAVRKRQYDTSDTANFDDRDRLRYEFDLVYCHKFSPRFRFISRAQTSLEHLVYIFAQKSDQNHWSRVFRLQPEVSFEPHPAWHNAARFELVANSTDYDFELDPAFIKSTIYRRWTASDSLVWDIERGWSMSLEYSIDLEDAGRFVWDDWIQQISEEYRTQRASTVIARQTHTGIRFEAGISVYERKGWEYSIDPLEGSVKSPFLYISRWGPIVRFIYPSESSINIFADGDLSWVHEWGRDDYSIINLDLRVTWQ